MSEAALIEPATGSESLVLKVTGKTTNRTAVFMKLKDVFPECEFLIQGEPQLYPLNCLRRSCHRGQNCMGKLASRVKYVFDTFGDAELLLLYFRYHDRPGSHRAGVFWRDGGEPRYITFNQSAWIKMKEIGEVYRWNLPDSIFLATSA